MLEVVRRYKTSCEQSAELARMLPVQGSCAEPDCVRPGSPSRGVCQNEEANSSLAFPKHIDMTLFSSRLGIESICAFPESRTGFPAAWCISPGGKALG